MDKQTNRILSYDIIRIFAILAVVMLHSSAQYVMYYLPGDSEFLFGNIFDSFSRIAVPFFIFLSGSFMLDENREVTNLKIKNKVLKLFFILIIWSAFYAICFSKNFVKGFFYGHYHLWYLYFIIGLYLITPILRLFVNIKNKKYIYYFIILAVIFHFLPATLDGIFTHHKEIGKFTNNFRMDFVGSLVVYYLLGWLIKYDFTKLKKYTKYFATAAIITAITIAALVQIKTTGKYKTYGILYSSDGFLVLMYSVCAFIALKSFAEKFDNCKNDLIKNLIIKLSSLTFGVYLVHAAWLQLCQNYIKSHHFSNAGLEILFCFVLTVPLSFLTSFLLSKIKYLKELIKI